MAYEIYPEVRACIVLLREAGLPQCADAIDGCLYGSTSGEILTDLGAGLSAILRTRRELTATVRGRLTVLLHEVDRSLRAVGHITPNDWREQALDDEH